MIEDDLKDILKAIEVQTETMDKNILKAIEVQTETMDKRMEEWMKDDIRQHNDRLKLMTDNTTALLQLTKMIGRLSQNTHTDEAQDERADRLVLPSPPKVEKKGRR
jgi:hypothetical protein